MAENTTKFLTGAQRRARSSNKKQAVTQPVLNQRTKTLTGTQRRALGSQRIAISRSAKEVSTQVNDIKNIEGLTISQLKNEIKSIDPIIRAQANVSEQQIEREHQKRINELNNKVSQLSKDIQESRTREREARKNNNQSREDKEDAKQDGFRQEQRELNKIIKRMKSGEIIDPERALQFAKDVGKSEKKFQLEKAENKSAPTLKNETITFGGSQDTAGNQQFTVTQGGVTTTTNVKIQRDKTRTLGKGSPLTFSLTQAKTSRQAQSIVEKNLKIIGDFTKARIETTKRNIRYINNQITKLKNSDLNKARTTTTSKNIELVKSVY